MNEEWWLKKIPAITNEQEYKDYKKRLKIGEKLIGEMWDSPAFKNKVDNYTFLSARILEWEQKRKEEKNV